MRFTTLLLLIILLCLGTECNYKILTAQNIKWIVFDSDGTLIDTLPLTIEFINEKLQCNPIEKEEFRENGRAKIIKDHLGLCGTFWASLSMPKWPSQCMDYFKANIDRITIFPGAEKLLLYLADKKYKLAIITAGDRDIVMGTLEKNGLTVEENKYKSEKAGLLPIFEGVYSDGFSWFWGIDGTIRKFLKIHKLNPDEIVYVGDEIDDIYACRKAGVKVISATWGYNTRAFLEQSEPDYLVDSFDELKSVIASLE